MITGEFNFHPIGQGSFYTGSINDFNNHDYFKCVYDCGVKPDHTRLNEEIELFKGGLHGKLDVLFLSHLDDDHVNEVRHLLGGIECSKVYLPYLTPIERLYVAIRIEAEGGDDNNFLGFVGSPHQYLLESENIVEIVYISGNSEGRVNRGQDIAGPVKRDDENGLVYDELEGIPEGEFNPEMREISTSPTGKKIKFKKGNKCISFKRIWEFYFFYEPASSEKVDELVAKIERLYGFQVTDQLSQDQLVQVLGNRDRLNELRKAYKKIFKDINRAGLLIQHKPINYAKAELYKYYEAAPFYHHFSPWYRRFSRRSFRIQNPTNEFKWGVTLLTGDIGIDQINTSPYINDHKESVRVFQIPHHGSHTHWDEQYLEHLNHNGLTSAIINFGYGNTHGHPDYKVLNDLDERNFEICFCNQFEGFNYEFVIE